MAASMVRVVGGSSPRSRARREEAVDFRLIFAASFAIFLTVAIFGRLLPPQWRPFAAGGPDGRSGSVIAEARTAANTFVPFVFMGY